MITNQHIIHVGVDIAKEKLAVCIPGGPMLDLPNTKDGARSLRASLRRLPGACHAVCEPTGGYEKTLVAELRQAGIPFSLVNPRQVRDFARAQGRLAKTDPLDARVLADYGAAFRPPPASPAAPAAAMLAELVDRRRHLLAIQVAEQSRKEHGVAAPLRRLDRGLVRVLKKQIAHVETLMDELIAREPWLGERARILTQVHGVGWLTACVMLAEMPELGTLTRRQAAALAGVAPFNRDSGHFHGQRHIRGGRANARKALYMASLSASQSNPVLRPFYQRLLAKGKPPKLALTAVMRKLVIYLNHLLMPLQFQLA